MPSANFRLYIKGKSDDYIDCTATYTHEQLILLASNKYNLLVQEGIFGAKSLEEEKIIAMQAELTALMGQFVLAPNLQRAAGDKLEVAYSCRNPPDSCLLVSTRSTLTTLVILRLILP